MSDLSPTANALALETSPYLQQHAHNPVHWYPWGPEALDRARRSMKPILLSIGYSACHWCHVMAHESFEDEATAALMNDHFVNIKVDREERPDLDRIYQTAHQLLTRRPGGWPLTVFLSPLDHAPFFAGTYFPPTARWGMPGFPDLLRRVAEVFASRREELDRQGGAVTEALQALMVAPEPDGSALEADVLERAREDSAAQFDTRDGGFGGAPKFPQPAHLERLLQQYAHSAARGAPDDEALHMATFTLERMALGGINDQLGGGFARYAVDPYWMIPHFEKMLYDNGPLLALYSEAYRLTGRHLFRRTAIDTAQWVLREMQSPEGAFYSSLDADSEGHEGRYYVWSRAEFEQCVTGADRDLLARHYGFDRAPNFEGSWHPHVFVPVESLAQAEGVQPEAVAARIDAARAQLLAARDRRVRPLRDDKVLTAWNALMIRGLAVAGRILQHPEFVQAATRAVDFIAQHLIVDGRLLATWRDGRAHLRAYLDDHAFLIDALLSLLEARWRARDLELATWLAERLLRDFADATTGGFWFTAHDHEALLLRPRSFSDDALPAGNGVAARALTRLGHLLGETRYLAAAESTLHAGRSAYERYPLGHDAMLIALQEHLTPTETVIVRGAGAPLAEFAAAALESTHPARLTLAIPSDATDLPDALAERRPSGAVTAYVCRGSTCLPPVTRLPDFVQLLRTPSP